LSSSSAAASLASKCGATIITDVALMRPRRINSRMAALTEREMP